MSSHYRPSFGEQGEAAPAVLCVLKLMPCFWTDMAELTPFTPYEAGHLTFPNEAALDGAFPQAGTIAPPFGPTSVSREPSRAASLPHRI